MQGHSDSQGFRGLDMEDQDLVMLDADTAGYASRVFKGPSPNRPEEA